MPPRRSPECLAGRLSCSEPLLRPGSWRSSRAAPSERNTSRMLLDEAISHQDADLISEKDGSGGGIHQYSLKQLLKSNFSISFAKNTPCDTPSFGTFAAMSGNSIAANRSLTPSSWHSLRNLAYVANRQRLRHLRSNPDHSADDIDRLSLNTVPAWIGGMVGQDRNAILVGSRAIRLTNVSDDPRTA